MTVQNESTARRLDLGFHGQYLVPVVGFQSFLPVVRTPRNCECSAKVEHPRQQLYLQVPVFVAANRVYSDDSPQHIGRFSVGTPQWARRRVLAAFLRFDLIFTGLIHNLGQV